MNDPRYDIVRSFGFVIDTRGAYALVILGMKVWEFENFGEALEWCYKEVQAAA